jgi:hypothetical protein
MGLFVVLLARMMTNSKFRVFRPGVAYEFIEGDSGGNGWMMSA